MPTRRVLMISGSLRDGSTNTAMLETARACAPEGVEAVLYEGLGGLPHFNPDDDVEPLDPPSPSCAAAIDAADAVLFSTPEYAGALPGSFKNLLDWTIGGGEIYEKPVGWINASAFGARPTPTSRSGSCCGTPGRASSTRPACRSRSSGGRSGPTASSPIPRSAPS